MKILKAAVMMTVGLALACSGSNQVASEYVKSSEMSAAQGATLSVDASESSVLAGASLSVSPRALDSDTTIHVALGKKNINESDQLIAGPVAIWSPAATHFNSAATMTLPITGSKAPIASLEVEVQHADKSTTAILPTTVTVESSRTLATFPVDQLGSYQVVSAQACISDGGYQACRNGKVCEADGYCRHPVVDDGGTNDGGYDDGCWWGADGEHCPIDDGGYGDCYEGDGGLICPPTYDGGSPDGGPTGGNGVGAGCLDCNPFADAGTSGNPSDGGTKKPKDGGF